jgi:hypothetical protein
MCPERTIDFMVRPKGFEPLTPRFVVWFSKIFDVAGTHRDLEKNWRNGDRLGNASDQVFDLIGAP